MTVSYAKGAATLISKTLSMMALSMMALSIMALSIIALSIMALGIIALSLIISKTRHSVLITLNLTLCHYAVSLCWVSHVLLLCWVSLCWARPKTVKAYYSYRKRSLYRMQCKAKCNRILFQWLVHFFMLSFFDRQSDHKIGKNHPVFWKVAKKVQNIFN
jgi:hypothetical protein